MTLAEESGSFFHKNFSEWWSEETENVFQRIERWAAYARGYNRLRSQRLSRGRMTMYENHQSSWSISNPNKLVVNDDSWTSHFQSSKRSDFRRSQPEATKLNCCGTFSYRSNTNLDSNCLETYSYDHSIYFKTIGDIRNSKRDLSKASDANQNMNTTEGSEIHGSQDEIDNFDDSVELKLPSFESMDIKFEDESVVFSAPKNKQKNTTNRDRHAQYEIEGLFYGDKNFRLHSDDNNNVIDKNLEWKEFQMSTELK